MKICYAVEIFTDTSVSDSLMGLVGGVFRFVTDNPGYEGSIVPVYGPNEIDVAGADIGDDDVLDWFYYGFLKKESFSSNPSRAIDIITVGNYATDSAFSFTIRNDVKFWAYCQTNGINLTGKRVVMWIAIDDVFYQCARGRITESPYTETDFTINVKDDAALIHKNIPPRSSALSGTAEVEQGDPIPVVFGNVPYSKVIKNDKDNLKIELNPVFPPFLYPAAATQYSTDYITYGSLVIYSSNTFSIDELKGLYLYVVTATISQQNSVVDRIYKIISNTASTVQGLITVTFDAPLIKESSGAGSSDVLLDPAEFNNPLWHHCLTGAYPNYISTYDTWWFQISDFSNKSYVSDKPVNVLDIFRYDSGVNKYTNMKGILRYSPNENPTVNLIVNTGTRDGKVTQYESIDLQLIKFGLSPAAGDGFSTEVYYDEPSIQAVTDKDRTTSRPFTTRLGFISDYRFRFDFKPQGINPSFINQVISNDYSALYLAIDWIFKTPSFSSCDISNIKVHWTITDMTLSEYTVGSANPQSTTTINIPQNTTKQFNFIDNSVIKNEGSDTSCYFGAVAHGDNTTYRSVLKINDIDPSIFVSPHVVKISLSFYLTVTSGFVDFEIKDVAIIGEKSIETIMADIYARTTGEKITGTSDYADSVYGSFKHILEDYDGIPPALIDYGTLAADRSSWPVSRTLTEQRNSIDYLNELCAHSFVGMFSGRTGKRVLRVLNFTGLTPSSGNGKTGTHNNSLIVRNSITSFEKSSIDSLYNSFLLQYCYDQGSDKFIRSFKVAHIEETAFPASGTADPDDASIPLWWSYFSGLQTSKDDWTVGYADSKTVWDICHASYLLNGVIKQAQGDVSQLNWFGDSLVWDSTDGSGTGTSCSAYKLLLILAQWCTLQKNVVSYSIPINGDTCETELLDIIYFNDVIYTNGANVAGWVVGIEVDVPNDQYKLTVVLQPGDIIPENLITELGPLLTTDTITESGAQPDTITETGV